MPSLILNGSQIVGMQQALLSAFNPSSFQQMLLIKLNKKLYHLVAASGLANMIFDIIQLSQEQNWTYDLIVAAREYNPGNIQLADFAREIGISVVPDLTSLSSLESIVRKGQPFIDFGNWLERASQVEHRICRIEISGSAAGTGFLIKPDLVLTNYHVIESVQGGDEKPEDVVMRFDYNNTKDGQVLNTGICCLLKKKDWLVDYSRYSQVDEQPVPKDAFPDKDELDYAVLRVDTEIGNDPVPAVTLSGSNQRGWIDIPSSTPKLQPNVSILFIVQHPKGQRLKLAAPDIMLGYNGNETRITYKVNTDNGSSGSPVFNNNWELVGLHHAGELIPLIYKIFRSANYNEGIPIKAIRSRLQVNQVL